MARAEASSLDSSVPTSSMSGVGSRCPRLGDIYRLAALELDGPAPLDVRFPHPLDGADDLGAVPMSRAAGAGTTLVGDELVDSHGGGVELDKGRVARSQSGLKRSAVSGGHGVGGIASSRVSTAARVEAAISGAWSM